ncbi:MAG: rRNA maturation RNase YbeY [Gemmatimonadaceae bacterium]
MTRVVAVETEGVRIAVSRDRVRRVAEHVLRAERVREALVSITFVSDRRIAALNARHLRHRGPTDVISFGFAPVGRVGAVVGDVYIAPEVARRNARAHRQGIREELLRLVVHGVLHVLGHDHPVSDARYTSPMWRRQERLLRAALAAA